ncbi:hypothetical protein [Burkholderia gladioli]|uniref:hypothetical protein n=1 Tax=Burkholderia gladioli TaxID=28095 RepID=UPI00163E7DAC|nr:hypothetical protein [Burkholderia gladioli]
MKHETMPLACAGIGRVVRHKATGDLAEVTGFYGNTHRFIRSLDGRTPHVVPLDEIEPAFMVGDAVRMKHPAIFPDFGIVEQITHLGAMLVRSGVTGKLVTFLERDTEFDPYPAIKGASNRAARETQTVEAHRDVSRETKSHLKHDKSTVCRAVAMVTAVALFPVVLVAGRWIRRIGQ